MRRPKQMLFAGALCAGLLLAPGTASAAVTCTFNTGTGELDVAVTNGTTNVALGHAAGPSTDILVDDSADLSSPIACTNGPASDTATASITVDETGSLQGTFLQLNFVNGRLAPGSGADDGAPEIEVAFETDTDGADQLTINGFTESANETFNLGDIAAGELGVNLNGDTDGDDVTVTNGEQLLVQPGTGDDDITFNGTGSVDFTGPVSIDSDVSASNGGDDVVSGSGLDNRFDGGLGNDSVIGGPNADSFRMEEGNDTFDGGGGLNDFVTYEGTNSMTGATLDLAVTAPQDTVAFGTDQVSNVEGVVGSNGPDRISGNGADNIIFGGNNIFDTGDDVLNGRGGADFLHARKGNDVLIGGQGNDDLEGDDGVDTVSFALESTAAVTFSLAPGQTNLPQVTGGAGNDTLRDAPSDADADHDVENLTGSPFGGDSLTGNMLANRIDVYDGLADTVDCIVGDPDVAIADEPMVDAITNCGTIDNAPQTTVASGPANGATVNTRTPAYALTANEPSSFQLQVDGGAFAACAATCSPPALSDGTHTLSFRAVDNDEQMHADLTPATRTVTIDATPPDTRVTGRTKVKTKKKTATITFGLASEPGATFECSLDGGAFTACGSSFSARVRRGSHTLLARATDSQGNVDASPGRATVRVVKKKKKK